MVPPWRAPPPRYSTAPRLPSPWRRQISCLRSKQLLAIKADKTPENHPPGRARKAEGGLTLTPDTEAPHSSVGQRATSHPARHTPRPHAGRGDSKHKAGPALRRWHVGPRMANVLTVAAEGAQASLRWGWDVGIPGVEARRGGPGEEFRDKGRASAKAQGQGVSSDRVSENREVGGRQQPLPWRGRG